MSIAWLATCFCRKSQTPYTSPCLIREIFRVRFISLTLDRLCRTGPEDSLHSHVVVEVADAIMIIHTVVVIPDSIINV